MAVRIDPAAVAFSEPDPRLDGRDLLLVFHGFGADEQDLLPIVPALGAAGGVVAALRGPFPYGPGWAWAPPDPLTTVQGAGLGPTADAVLTWLDALEATAGRPARTRLLGFSQGGLVAMQLLRQAPARFDRVVLLAGFVPEGSHPGDVELATRRPPVFFGVGDADPVIADHPDGAAWTLTWLETHATAAVHRYSGLGHAVSNEEVREVAAFLGAPA